MEVVHLPRDRRHGRLEVPVRDGQRRGETDRERHRQRRKQSRGRAMKGGKVMRSSDCVRAYAEKTRDVSTDRYLGQGAAIGIARGACAGNADETRHSSAAGRGPARARTSRSNCKAVAASSRHREVGARRQAETMRQHAYVRIAFSHLSIDPVGDPSGELQSARADRKRRQKRVIETTEAYADDEQHRYLKSRRDVEHVGRGSERNEGAACAFDDDGNRRERRVAHMRPR